MIIKLDTQKIYSWTIAYMLSFLGLLNLGNEILNVLSINAVLDTALLYALLFGMVFIGLVLCAKDYAQFKIDVLCVGFFFALTFILSAIIYSENMLYLFSEWTDYSGNHLYIIFLYSLPGYFFVRQLKKYDYLIKYMRIFSYIVVCMSIFVFFLSRDSSAAQYMTFSYNMLTQLFFIIIYTPDKYRIIHSIVVALGIFVFLFGGARGATISFLIAGMIYFLSFNKITGRQVFSTLFVGVGTTAFVIFKEEVLTAIDRLLGLFSIDSRTFQMLLSGEMLSDDIRVELYRSTWDKIGLLGNGFMGDRVILNNYPHNLFMELLIQFGWVIGIVLCVLICICLVVGLYKKQNAESVLIFILLPCGFIKLMMTGSYLNQEPAFYILLGLCVNSILRRDKTCEY